MASWKDRILEGIEADLVEGKKEAESLLLKAAAAAKTEYTVILRKLEEEAADPAEKRKRDAKKKEAAAKKKEAEKKRKEAAAAADLAQAEKIQAAAAKLTAAKLTAEITQAAAARAEEEEKIQAEYTAEIQAAEKIEAEIQAAEKGHKEAAAAAAKEAAAAILGKGKGKGSKGSSLTASKVQAVDLWIVGPHREGKSSLLTDHKYTGTFLFRPSDRALLFLPQGEAYTAAALGKYTDLNSKEAEYTYIGRMVDHKETRSLTGIVRWCREWIYTADLDEEAEKHTERTNRRAAAGNLFKNAGGTVFAQAADPAEYTADLAKIPDLEAEKEAAEKEADPAE